MRQLEFKAKMNVLDLYLQGLSADGVVEKSGVSKGAVVAIIKDAREGKYPQLELKGRVNELHQLAVRLRKENLDITQAGLGFSFLHRIAGIGIEPEQMEEWLRFCEELSPSPPEGFIPASMSLLRIEKETGLSYTELATQVNELIEKRQKLIDGIGDLETKETRYGELKAELEASERKAGQLKLEKDRLAAAVDALNSFIRQRATDLGIPPSELEAKLKELIDLDAQINSKRSDYNRLQGEVDALSERCQRLSSQMEKSSADFERDIKLLKQIRQEVAAIAEMKGKYEQELEHLEWAARVLPFLSDPDKVGDPDFDLVAIVVNCIDKWIHLQSQWRFTFSLRWDEVKSYVEKQRTQP
ncbi:hypothetical protein ACFLXC_01555 [Chloroflexota bacterium]